MEGIWGAARGDRMGRGVVNSGVRVKITPLLILTLRLIN